VRELHEEIGLKLNAAPKRLFKLAACAETDQEHVWVYRCEAEGRFGWTRMKSSAAVVCAGSRHALMENGHGFCERVIGDLEEGSRSAALDPADRSASCGCNAESFYG